MKLMQQLLNQSRLLTVLHDNLAPETRSSELYELVSGYLEKYASYNHADANEIIDIYTRYITAFNKHCKLFSKTGQYPQALGNTNFTVSRKEYDLVLLLSVLFTEHRFRIMQLLKEKASPTANALFIGLGSGLEIEITKDNYREVIGYDLSVNEYLYQQFPAISLNIELYKGQQHNHFDDIYLIELLEHLSRPVELLETCYGSLKKGGRIFLTTATDIPQFDHLFNFKADHTDFETVIGKMGFTVLYKELIPHHYLSMGLQPCNHFYTIEKV